MKSEKLYKILTYITDFLQKFAIEFTKAFINTQVGQGLLKRVIGFLVDKMFDEIVDPIVKVALVRIGYYYDVKEGKRLIKTLEQAKEDGDVANYNATVDDILG